MKRERDLGMFQDYALRLEQLDVSTIETLCSTQTLCSIILILQEVVRGFRHCEGCVWFERDLLMVLGRFPRGYAQLHSQGMIVGVLIMPSG